MPTPRIDLITGATGFSGRHIAERLRRRGVRVRTLTRQPGRVPPESGIEAFPYAFDDPARLRRSLHGVDTLYNTYWIRFERGSATFARAVLNSRRLFEAARAAGVRRIVHVSIANPDERSPLRYYRGKAAVERSLRESTVPYAILRPTVLFGDGGLLLHNIAWLLRRFPLFAVAGCGDYGIQPVSVADLAELAVELGEGRENVALDAAGPEVFAFADLVRCIRDALRSRARVVHVPPWCVLALSRALGALVRDVVLTPDELAGLRAGLLVSRDRPLCETRFSRWLEASREVLGREYQSELALHYR